MLLALVIEITITIVGYCFKNSICSEPWESIGVQFVQNLFSTFLVQCPIYFAVYCYLEGKIFQRETVFETLQQRALRLLGISLLRTAISVIFGQMLPEFNQSLMGRIIPRTWMGYGGNSLSALLIWLIHMALDFWLGYLCMTVLVSEPGERGLFQKATRAISQFFGVRLSVIESML